MYHTIEITKGAWGYLTNLSDFSGGKVFKAGQTPDGRHTLDRGNVCGTVQPGLSDGDRQWGGYGSYRPYDAADDKERAVNDVWEKRNGTAGLDYYIALRNGSPDPSCAAYIYGSDGFDKLFIHGEDGEGNDLPRYQLLEHLKAIGVRASPAFWDPCQIFHGLKGGFPTFHTALRTETNIGPSWYDVTSKLKGELPPGYSWDGHHTLYFDNEDVEEEVA